MHVTWWMPGMLAGKTRTSVTDGRGRKPMLARADGVSFGPLQVLGRLVLDPGPDLPGERVGLLLLQMAHQPDRPRHDGEAPANLPREPELARDGADGAGRVHGELAAEQPARLVSHHL